MKKFVIIFASFVILVVIVVVLLLTFFPRKYRNKINEYANEFGLSSSMIASVINVESGYDKLAVSSAGAIGLMQLLPSTASECASRVGIDLESNSLFDESINIRLGCYYLQYLLQLYEGNTINALCAYNWGLSNVNDWIAMGNVDTLGTITDIPVKETKRYITKFKICFFVYEKIFRY